MSDLSHTTLLASSVKQNGGGLTSLFIHYGVAQITSANKGASPKKGGKREPHGFFGMLGWMML